MDVQERQMVLIPEEIVEPPIQLVRLTDLPPDDTLVSPEPTQTLIWSMERYGLLQPIVVIDAPEEEQPGIVGRPQNVVAGRRRIKAARRLGWEVIATRIYPNGYSAGQILTLVENDARSPNRQAELQSLYQLTQGGASDDKLKGILRLTQAQLDRKRRLMALPPLLMEAVISGQIAPTVAESIVRLPAGTQQELVQTYSRNGTVTTQDVYDITRAVQQTALAGLEGLASLDNGTTEAAPVVEQRWEMTLLEKVNEVLAVVPEEVEDPEWQYYLGQLEQAVEFARGKLGLTATGRKRRVSRGRGATA